MGRVGNIVSDPKIGAYCDAVLESGETLLVNHDKGGMKGGRLTVEKKKWMGLGSDQFFACDLRRDVERPHGLVRDIRMISLMVDGRLLRSRTSSIFAAPPPALTLDLEVETEQRPILRTKESSPPHGPALVLGGSADVEASGGQGDVGVRLH